MFNNLIKYIALAFALSGCHSYYAEYNPIIYSYEAYSGMPIGAKKTDVPLLLNNEAILIGNITVFGYPNSNNRNDPIDAALEEATIRRATHIVFIDEKIVDQEYNCFSNMVYNRIYTQCSANSQMAYYYNLYIVPQKNWKELPKKLKPYSR